MKIFLIIVSLIMLGLGYLIVQIINMALEYTRYSYLIKKEYEEKLKIEMSKTGR